MGCESSGARTGSLATNYFNYFTEIEDHFQKARGTSLFLLSPLDWALIETWKQGGVPLEAVLKGIDRTFEKWHTRKHKRKLVNSLAYCAQEVLAAAQEPGDGENQKAGAPPFTPEELSGYLRQNADLLRRASAQSAAAAGEVFLKIADTLDGLANGPHGDLEALEQQMTVLEELVRAAAIQARSQDDLLEMRREMERRLTPYRSKMNAAQLATLERQYLDRLVLEAGGLPRLSLFYL